MNIASGKTNNCISSILEIGINADSTKQIAISVSHWIKA